MISIIVFYVLLILCIAVVIWYIKTRDYDNKPTFFATVICLAILFAIIAGVHTARVVVAHINVDAQYAELHQQYVDLQKQVDTYTDERALESVMQRVEEYNQKVAYGKEACHSAWNYLLYPARIYDNLKFVMMPEG